MLAVAIAQSMLLRTRVVRRHLPANPAHYAATPADSDLLPDPCDAGFYVRCVELCRKAGVDPSPPERVRELTSKWNAMLSGDPAGALTVGRWGIAQTIDKRGWLRRRRRKKPSPITPATKSAKLEGSGIAEMGVAAKPCAPRPSKDPDDLPRVVDAEGLP